MIEIGADKLVVWDGLIDNLTDTYVNDATVTGAITELDGTSVGTFTLNYESASDGKYEGIIPAATTTTLTSCREYLIVLTATKSGAIGKRTVREVAIDSATCWLRWNHPYLSSLTFDSEGIVSMMILAAQESIEKIIGRTIKETEFDEILTAGEFGGVYLKNFPITYVARVQASTVDAITIQNTSASNASFSVTATGVKLTKYSAGTRTTTNLTFAANPTIYSMAYAIGNLGGGWASEVTDSSLTSYPSSDLVLGQYGECATASNQISMWAEDNRQFTVDNRLGVICGEFSRGMKIRSIYGAGFSDVPEPLKRIAADMVKNHFDGKEGALASESLGDYSYSLASMTEQIKSLPINNLKVLNSYKANQVR